MRYQAGLTLPSEEETCLAVAPTVLQKPTCPKFRKIEVMHTAVGFSNIFREVKQRHAPEMRSLITAYLGGNGTYYRYLHGERALTPEQQQWIRNLFARYGYPDDVPIDGYEERYRFYDS